MPISTAKVVKKYGTPTKRGDASALAFHADKATKRIIAPYVNIVRRGKKAALAEGEKTLEFLLQSKPSILKRNLNQFLDDTVDLPTLLHESVDALKCATDAAGGRLYMVNSALNEIYISPRNQPNPLHKISWKIEEGTTLAAYVAHRREYVMIEDILTDPRFPDGIPYTDPTVKSVLCVPVVTPDNECLCVIELYRDVLQREFQRAELKITVVIAGWMGTSIHQNKERMVVQRQQKLNECLMDLTKCYFAGDISLNKLINEIVIFAKQTIDAEKATFYILNPDDMTAEIYDENLGGTSMLKRQIKANFAKDRSIASTVARTGKTINVQNAITDYKDLKDIELRYGGGSIERSVLAMPIMGAEKVLGVVEAVNKVSEQCFSKTDEDVFRTFTLYCALALYHSKIIAAREKSKVTFEVVFALLKRHVLPCGHELQALRENLEFDEPVTNLNDFGWYIPQESISQMPQMVYFMITNISDIDYLEVHELMKFILSVKKFYRHNPYHNWEHGFTVSNCIYNILRRNLELFAPLERTALFVAALCHDIDHGGVTNSFLHLNNDYIAQLYDESAWENHHYFVTIMLLNEMRIFKNINGGEYRNICRIIKNGILATDFSNYFRTRAKLVPIVMDDCFDWSNPIHRNMLIAVTMTACDLSGNCKPFPISKKITDRLYNEFYRQGDVEKKLGYIPLSMMDRDKQARIPDDQVEFLNVLVMPVCDLLRKCFPNTSPLYDEAANLKDAWLEVIRIRNERCWNIDESVLTDGNIGTDAADEDVRNGNNDGHAYNN